jgi:hypothetical protein
MMANQQATQQPTKQPAQQPTGKDYSTVPTRCLSVCEPWAWAIVAGHKSIENRTWATNAKGRIAIHASSSNRHYTEESDYFLCNASPDIEAALNDSRATDGTHEAFNFGAIIGVVDVLGCVDMEKEEGDNSFNDVMRKRFGGWLDAQKIPPETWADPGSTWWCLANPIQFARPIRAKGALNVWNLSPDLQAMVAAELAYTAAHPPIGGLIEAAYIVSVKPANTKAVKAETHDKRLAKSAEGFKESRGK